MVELIKENKISDKEIYILGKSFKPETNITTGSPAILLENLLKENNIEAISYDPYVDKKSPEFKVGLYFIGTKHDIFENFDFPKGSVVLDPFRMINSELDGVKVIRIGDNHDNRL